MNTRTKLIITAVLALLVGFIAGHSVGRTGDDADVVATETENEDTPSLEQEDVATDTETTTETEPTIVATGNSVNVEDQNVGNVVLLSRIELVRPGWVAVHEVNANGELGNILGAHWYDSGVHQGSMNLLRGMEPGREYAATLWVDRGDTSEHVFDHEVDEMIPNTTFSFKAY